jgi:hypothetical protein
MTSYSFEEFIKQYPSYRFIDSYTFYESTAILLRQKENPFTNPDSKPSLIIKAGCDALHMSSWADVQDVNNLQSILQNTDFRRDFKKFRKSHPLTSIIEKVETIDWIADHLMEVQKVPQPPCKKPQKPGPCPWVLQKGALYPKECWAHRYYDPTVTKQLEENGKLIAQASQEKKEVASLHHIRRHLEAKQKQAPESCPWIHPDSLQWNAEWSINHLWETLEEREVKWSVYYDQPKKYIAPASLPKPLGDHYGTEVHSYRIGEGTGYRNLVDGYKRDLLSAIQIAQKPLPRYPPRPPLNLTQNQNPHKYSFQRV